MGAMIRSRREKESAWFARVEMACGTSEGDDIVMGLWKRAFVA